MLTPNREVVLVANSFGQGIVPLALAYVSCLPVSVRQQSRVGETVFRDRLLWISFGVPVAITKLSLSETREEEMRVMSILDAMIVFGLLTLGIGDVRGREDQTRSIRDWPMYGRDLRHSFSNPHSLINPTNVATLRPVWDFTTQDVVSASPAVVGDIVFVGSWDGYFYAIDASEGSLRWKFQVDCQNSVIPIPSQCLARQSSAAQSFPG